MLTDFTVPSLSFLIYKTGITLMRETHGVGYEEIGSCESPLHMARHEAALNKWSCRHDYYYVTLPPPSFTDRETEAQSGGGSSQALAEQGIQIPWP